MASQQIGEAISSLKDEDITIGEALEVAATLSGDKPVDKSDAAAIQAAEMQATGTTAPPLAGVGLEAQAAAMANARRIYESDKTTFAEVIGDAREKLEKDKAVTKGDAEKVMEAELQGNGEGLMGGPNESVTSGGVAETVATAATLNKPDQFHHSEKLLDRLRFI